MTAHSRSSDGAPLEEVTAIHKRIFDKVNAEQRTMEEIDSGVHTGVAAECEDNPA